LLETDDGHISRIEHSQKRPSSDLILRISRLFDVSTDQLMKDELELDE
jgi:transcriptional regulator with XRE-family HTH domain